MSMSRLVSIFTYGTQCLTLSPIALEKLSVAETVTIFGKIRKIRNNTFGKTWWNFGESFSKNSLSAQRSMERSMMNIRLADQITNKTIRKTTKVEDVAQTSIQLKWNWAGSSQLFTSQSLFLIILPLPYTTCQPVSHISNFPRPTVDVSFLKNHRKM